MRQAFESQLSLQVTQGCDDSGIQDGSISLNKDGSQALRKHGRSVSHARTTESLALGLDELPRVSGVRGGILIPG